ncbi:MAG: tetratricopeptide repeat protein [Sulfuricaulis sp.]|nr:tetratricopeptide repeat protein [Sulfuricaulis sp.]
MNRSFQAFLFVTYLLSLSSPVSAADYGQFGPFDYYDLKNTPHNALPLVERAHFGAVTKNRLRRGEICSYWGDLDYTLRAFPNHPGALMAMVEYLEAGGSTSPCAKKAVKRNVTDLAVELEKGAWQEKTADYYFETAIEFRPQHAATRVLYGRYQHKEGRLNEALKTYTEAEKLDPKSADLHYYLGLLYFDMKNNVKAMYHAEIAYRLGQQLPELRDKLTKANAWKNK